MLVDEILRNDMLVYALVAFILSLGVTLYSVPQVLYVAHQRKLTDIPDGIRKKHVSPTPNLGGISIFLGFMLSAMILLEVLENSSFLLTLAGAFLLFVVGMKDDLVGMGAGKKLLAQIVAAGLMVYGNDVFINNMGGVFGLHDVPIAAAQVATLFSVVVIINAFNLIDGVDGLAGSIGLTASVALGVLLFMNGAYAQSMVAWAIGGSLLGFLYFNFEPAQIFMGDTGSMMTGYVLSFLGFSAMQVTTPDAALYLPAVAVFVFAVLGIPMFDTLRIIILRIKEKKSPLHPDFNHVHHELLRIGFGHRGVTLILAFSNIVIIAVAWALRDVNAHVQLLVMAMVALAIIPSSRLFRKLLKTQARAKSFRILHHESTVTSHANQSIKDSQ